jgi:hypothetical protein
MGDYRRRQLTPEQIFEAQTSPRHDSGIDIRHGYARCVRRYDNDLNQRTSPPARHTFDGTWCSTLRHPADAAGTALTHNLHLRPRESRRTGSRPLEWCIDGHSAILF